MSGLSDLITATDALCRRLGFQATALPGDLEDASRETPSGPLTIGTRIWSAPAIGEWRAAAITSRKIDIVSMFFYPEPACGLPVYAMELVRLGRIPLIGVIDLPTPPGDCAEADARQWLRQARAACPSLRDADDPPDWYRECRSGDDIFVRPRDEREFDLATVLHLNLQTRVALASAHAVPRPPQDAAGFAAFVRGYKDHQCRHSPGLPLLEKSFGAAWTRRYLDDCFFA